MPISCVFTNDDNVNIIVPDHIFSKGFIGRNNHEVLFRKLNTYLIKNNIIQNNIIDLGAWIGDNTIPWAKNIDGVVYAIDPSINNCDFINKTAILNNLYNVKVINTAISDKNENLYTNECIDHCSFVYDNHGLEKQTQVQATSLDDLYLNKEISDIGYIHLDVEGMEYKVLLGSSKLIDDCRPIITFEQHLDIDDHATLLDFLINKHYRIFLIDEVLNGCRPDCRNFIAFPNEKFDENIVIAINKNVQENLLLTVQKM